jgi:glutathione peroxidase
MLIAALPLALGLSPFVPGLHSETTMTRPGANNGSIDALVLDHEAERIDGTVESLAEVYKGRVVLIVNVASRCGYTPQYEDLEALYREHAEQGLVVLGFPCNDFGAQEPGSNDEVHEFCTSTFDVTFPMFAKVAVLGDEAHPLYMDLRQQPAPIGGEPKWNFTKFLVGRDGRVLRRFEPKDTPMGETIRAAVAEALAAQPL